MAMAAATRKKQATDIVGSELGKCTQSTREGITYCTMMRQAVDAGPLSKPLWMSDGGPKIPVFVEVNQGRGKAKLNLFLRLCPWCGEKLQ